MHGCEECNELSIAGDQLQPECTQVCYSCSMVITPVANITRTASGALLQQTGKYLARAAPGFRGLFVLGKSQLSR